MKTRTKIAFFTVNLILLYTVIFLFGSLYNMRRSLETVVTQSYEMKLKGDINSAKRFLALEHGNLRIENHKLIDEKGQSLEGHDIVVDQINFDLGDDATILFRDGDNFVRIATNILDEDGNRIVGTKMDRSSPIYRKISQGESYIGPVEILGRPYFASYTPIKDTDFQNVAILFVGAPLEEINYSMNKNLRTTTISFVIFTIISIAVISAILSLIITRLFAPVKRMVKMLRDLSEGEGDLTKRLTVRNKKSEFNEMAKYFNLTLEKIRNILISIKEDSKKSRNLGESLSIDMSETASAVNEIVANIKQISGQTENQNDSLVKTGQTMQSITSHIDTLNKLIETQVTNITESSAAIEETLANISTITGTLEKNKNDVDELEHLSQSGLNSLENVLRVIGDISKESEGLLEISSIIEEIAGQTNLLSMNAAIEASHAGDSGRGFAVVAEEIRKLADNSSKQVGIITNILRKMKDSITGIVESTNEVSAQFRTVVERTGSVHDQVVSITQSMEEQSAGNKQVLAAVTSLNEITSEVKDSSNEMLNDSKKVISEMDSLSQITESVKIGVSEMASGTEEITKSIAHVEELSNENRESIVSMNREIDKFKLKAES